MDNHDKPRPGEQKQLDCPDNIEPGMHGDEVIDRAAPFLHRGQGVVIATVFQGTAET